MEENSWGPIFIQFPGMNLANVASLIKGGLWFMKWNYFIIIFPLITVKINLSLDLGIPGICYYYLIMKNCFLGSHPLCWQYQTYLSLNYHDLHGKQCTVSMQMSKVLYILRRLAQTFSASPGPILERGCFAFLLKLIFVLEFLCFLLHTSSWMCFKKCVPCPRICCLRVT